MSKPFRLVEKVTPEHQVQIETTKMLRWVLRPAVAWSAIDHADGRAVQRIDRSRRGVRSGLPDYLFVYAGRSYFIELKVRGGALSDEQRRFIDELLLADAQCAVCFGRDAVFEQVRSWGLTRVRD